MPVMNLAIRQRLTQSDSASVRYVMQLADTSVHLECCFDIEEDCVRYETIESSG